MIISAMIFAGMTLIVGVLVGFLLGQARTRMSYEEKLSELDEARIALEGQVARLRETLGSKGQTHPGIGPAGSGEAGE